MIETLAKLRRRLVLELLEQVFHLSKVGSLGHASLDVGQWRSGLGTARLAGWRGFSRHGGWRGRRSDDDVTVGRGT
jgi:hypothetical protein